MGFQSSVRLCGAAFVLAIGAGCGGSQHGGDSGAQSLAASVVIGQASFEEGGDGGSPPPLHRLTFPVGSPGVTPDGTLFVAGNSGIRAFRNYDRTSGPTAQFNVPGNARGAFVHEDKLLSLADNRVDFYEPLPTDGDDRLDFSLGGEPGCTTTRMRTPGSAHVTPFGHLVVADTDNHRVLIWKGVSRQPGQAADIVIGQPRWDTCLPNAVNADGTPDANGAASAQTLNAPTSVWSDGVKLVVVDSGNHRVLVYDFPTSSRPAASVVIGQSNFTGNLPNAGLSTPSGATLSRPSSVDVRAGGQMAIADSDNHRVLLWDTVPQANAQPADKVIGQADFSGGAPNRGGDPSARTLRKPAGVRFDRSNLIVVDRDNHRVLVFRSQ